MGGWGWGVVVGGALLQCNDNPDEGCCNRGSEAARLQRDYLKD